MHRRLDNGIDMPFYTGNRGRCFTTKRHEILDKAYFVVKTYGYAVGHNKVASKHMDKQLHDTRQIGVLTHQRHDGIDYIKHVMRGDAVADILHTQTGKLTVLLVVAPIVLALDVDVGNENKENEDYQCCRNKYYDVVLTSYVCTALSQVGIASEKSGIVAVAIVHFCKIGHVADTAYGIVVLVYLYTISVCLGIIALLGKILHETLIVKIEICRTNSRIIVRQ